MHMLIGLAAGFLALWAAVFATRADVASRRALKAAEQALHAMRPYVRYVDSSRYIDNLANGDICLAMGWSGDVKQAHDRAKEAGKGVELAYTIPREGAISNYDVLAIPADAPHVRNAHLFINYLLRPEIAARNGPGPGES